MAICQGIITEEGGLTSHAAIVSRELGKPCLIGVEGCTTELTDGDRIKVINGKIYKLK
jgi:pyruvate,water dikinase